jgi:diguanylate cyclase (GGDEF)-like protein
MIRLLALAALCTLLIGALGSVYISRRLSYPIAKLAKAVENAGLEAGDVPDLPKTDILEIDQFAEAITKLSHDALDNASKFLSIMELASVEMGGFRVRKDENTLFVTRNLFGMFGRPDLDEQTMSKGRFMRTMRRLHAGLQHTQSSDGSLLYAVPQPEGTIRYLRLETAWDGDICVGLVEDVTQTTKERMRIEHERDYDLLTGLYNRRAFVREAQELFDQPHAMGVAAVMMMDLDGLKSVNDSFGHEYGDTYIRLAAGCIANTGALCSRVSGDEFYLLFYGHFGKESILQTVARLRESLSATHMDLPNGNSMPLRASGGIAWYPDDGTDLIELMRLADFAMYQIKNNGKGAVGEFNIEAYTEAQRLMELRQEFQLFLAEERVTYFFQPIVDAHTGDIHAYEALMRTVDMPTLRSPQDVIDLARMENKLGEIERLTWFKASEAYELLLQRGQVDENALMFLNSIANECMSGELFAEYYKRHAEVRSRIVIEITEQEGLDLNATTLKRTRPGSTGLLALDDYGSGYNSEKNLLALAPNYIKIDMEIVRDIDKDQDKRQLVANTVQYAHSHGMKVIAEGLETPEEITTVVTLGVDLLQGYFLARPAAVPDAPSPQSVELLKQLREQSDRQAYI